MVHPSLRFCASLSAALFVHAALPAQTQWEANVFLEEQESSSDPLYAASVTRYFAPLEATTNAPLAELPFVNRIGRLEVGFSRQKETRTERFNYDRLPQFPSLELGSRRQSIQAAYRYADANSPHRFSASMGYQEIELDSPRFIWWHGGPDNFTWEYEIVTQQSNIFNYQVGYDFHLADAWTVGASVALNETRISDTYSFRLETNRLWDLGNEQWLGIQAAITRMEAKTINQDFDGHVATLEGRYYLSKRTGISLGVELPEGGFSRSYEAGIHHFLTDQLGLSLDYRYTKFDVAPILQPDGNLPDDSDSAFKLSLGYRF